MITDKYFKPGKYFGKDNKPTESGMHSIKFNHPTKNCKYIKIMRLLALFGPQTWEDICKTVMPKSLTKTEMSWKMNKNIQVQRKYFGDYNRSLRYAMIRDELIDAYPQGKGKLYQYNITTKGKVFLLDLDLDVDFV